MSDRYQTGSCVHKGLKIQHIKVRRGLGKKCHSRDERCQIFYANVNGHRSKADNLKQIIEEVKPAIILLCETKVYENSSIKIEVYQVFSAVRQTKQGGGLAFTVRNKYCQPLMIDKGDNAEFLNEYDPKEVIDEFYQNVMIQIKCAIGSGDRK